MSPSFSPEIMIPVGRVLLLGTSGYAIYQVIRGEYEFEEAITGALVGMLGLTFFLSGFQALQNIGDSFLSLLSQHMSRDTLKEQIVGAIQASGTTRGGRLPDNGEFFSQIWRAGIWGVVSSLVELLFILADILIESAQQVFLKLIIFLFPIGCGLFPLFPKIFTNLVVYAFELSFWRPIMILIHEVTAQVGKVYLANDSTQGLKIIAVEIVAIVLIFSIPSVTHKIMNGALAGDMGAGGGFEKAGRKVYGSVSSMMGGVLK